MSFSPSDVASSAFLPLLIVELALTANTPRKQTTRTHNRTDAAGGKQKDQMNTNRRHRNEKYCHLKHTDIFIASPPLQRFVQISQNMHIKGDHLVLECWPLTGFLRQNNCFGGLRYRKYYKRHLKLTSCDEQNRRSKQQ